MYLLTSSEVDRQVLSALQKKIEVKFKGQTTYQKDDYVIYLTGLKVEDLREFLIFEDVKRKNHLYSKHVLYYLKDAALTVDAISISGIESKIRLVEKELFKKFSIIKSNDIIYKTKFLCDIDFENIISVLNPYISGEKYGVAKLFNNSLKMYLNNKELVYTVV